MTVTEHYRRAEALLVAVEARRQAAGAEMHALVDKAQTEADFEAVNAQILALHKGLALDVQIARVHAALAAIAVPVGGRS